MPPWQFFLAALALVLLPACAATGPDNPSFPLSVPEARMEINEMTLDKKPLPRPLVLIGGYGDLGISQYLLLKTFLNPSRTTPNSSRFPCSIAAATTIAVRASSPMSMRPAAAATPTGRPKWMLSASPLVAGSHDMPQRRHGTRPIRNACTLSDSTR